MGNQFPLMGIDLALMGNKNQFPLMRNEFPLMGNDFNGKSFPINEN